MAWTASGMFTRTMMDLLVGGVPNTGANPLDLDAASNLKVALYDNDVTPAYDAATQALVSYNGASSTWVAAGDQTGSAANNQVFHTGQWTQGGPVLTTPACTQVGSNGLVMFDADNSVSGAAATMSNIYGCFIYGDVLSTNKQGLVAVYFGGTAFSVTNGTFTIQWDANGIFRLDIA
jgi:hypothetical protein